MRLLQRSDDGEFTLTKDYIGDDTIPPYAILSHTWKEGQEVTFQDLMNGTGKSKTGYSKIQFCGQQAEKDGLQYFWVDTCCIDKFNAVELQEAVNSMFRWYQNAAKCYVYLSDVWKYRPLTAPDDINGSTWEPAFQGSRWFRRGWTLQELLAPQLVDFYSQDGYHLGDKTTLERQISNVTGVDIRALKGSPLHEFSVEERLLWAKDRLTTRKEDRAYSLLGIFGIHMVLNYGEGEENAFGRLRKKIDKRLRGAQQQQSSVQVGRQEQECVRNLRLTDPRDDKKRIEETKGGLLEDSYHWILEAPNFQQWRDDQQSQLLWIKGDPGKGKTMLLCGIINELSKMDNGLLSFFFCQGTDSRINSAIAVLRGLTYLLVDQQPSLAWHLQNKYDQAGPSLFEDTNAWIAMSDIFTNMVQDLDRKRTDLKVIYLVVDALDECVVDLPKLLNLIAHTSSVSSRVKWLLSSRNEAHIEQKLRSINDESRLSLELKQNAQQVSHAVNLYIDNKLSNLETLEDDGLRDQVRDILRQKANGTFLWVALVVQELERPESWDPLQVVEEAPTGLYELYDRMIEQIQRLKKSNLEICRLLLSTVSVAYRPLHLAEIASLCGLPGQVSVLTRNITKIVAMCGSFLTIRNDQVYLIHQSAKDYLSDEERTSVFHSQPKSKIHYDIFSQSLKIMSSTLKRDMYGLVAVGYSIDKVQIPPHDPLATMRYSCIYWVDHLYNAVSNSVSSNTSGYHESLKDGSATHIFFKKRYLYWLEALSLCKSMSAGVTSMARLEALLQERDDVTMLKNLVQDARRFIMYHKSGIEASPLQVYVSALLFSPTGSLIKKAFKHEEPKYITLTPAIGDSWSACLLTLEGHRESVMSVALSHDSVRLASASVDKSVKVWDTSSGECLSTFEGHSSAITSVAYSHDSTLLASASKDWTVKIWDASSGECLLTLEGHSGSVNSVAFSHDSTRVASASLDRTVKIWDATSGKCLSTIEAHRDSVTSAAFSPDSTRLASTSLDISIKIWDVSSGKKLSTLKGHRDIITSVAFSHDSARLASASMDWAVKIWDASSGECLLTLDGHNDAVLLVAFSHDSARLASSSSDTTAKIWDTSSGECLSTLEGHSNSVNSVAFSHDSKLLASASVDRTIKIWDAENVGYQSTFRGYDSSSISAIAFSYDSARLASGSSDRTVKIWNASSGTCSHILTGHQHFIPSVAFSYDSAKLASASWDQTVKIWDVSSGECLFTLSRHNSHVNTVAFTHDSTRLASASWDRTVNIWNARNGECLLTLKGHQGSVDVLAFSHDSAQLASASWDRTVKIWDASSGECLLTLEGHSDKVNSVAFSPDSTRLASASRDRTVKIWDTRSGECLSTLQTDRPLFNISFDATGTYLHTDTGGMIDTNAVLTTPHTSQSQYPHSHRVALSPDKTWITYGSRNLLWLPSEHRPSCSAVSGNKIGIGVGSGKVWICEIEPSESLGFLKGLSIEDR